MNQKILMVEDDNDQRNAVRLILETNGYRVAEAADCETALLSLGREKFDLILLDITLPDKSGFRVLEYLRENCVPSRVIVVTGTVGLESATRSSSLGARDYIRKPYNPAYLLKSIEHVLSEHLPSNLKLQIVKGGDYIKSTLTGDLDMEASKKGFAQIAAVDADIQDCPVLIDLRDVNSRLSTTDIYELASELGKYGDTFRNKTAVLARADQDIDQAMFFENVAQNQGFKVKAFTVFEDAMIWLSNITLLTEYPS